MLRLFISLFFSVSIPIGVYLLFENNIKRFFSIQAETGEIIAIYILPPILFILFFLLLPKSWPTLRQSIKKALSTLVADAKDIIRSENSDSKLIKKQKAGNAEAQRKFVEETIIKAEAGDAEAQDDLGFMYFHGDGVPEDKAKAVQWFTRAAKQGYAGAQTNLGFIQIKLGLKAVGVSWLKKAADQGDTNAKKILSELCDDLADFEAFPQAYGEFGLCVTNPVPTCGIQGSNEYLASLQTEGGDEILSNRLGSTRADNIEYMIDRYQIFNKRTNKEICELYLCPYSKVTSSIAPDGFEIV